jgi:hypothetical protein
VDLVSLVSNSYQRIDQNFPRNLLSLVKDDGLWYPKIDPHSFEEELGSICHCDVLLVGCEDGHLRKSINDHKYTIIVVLGGWKDRHVIHRDEGFSGVGRGVYNPCFLMVGLEMAHAVQDMIYLLKSYRSFGQ